ncbi:MAG TPA: sn-glycerol-3-phosphate ABC transporter ATP-binding protein UgpC [Rhodothermales bacterium]|nr:sn-glycerol-3-phosphate ABC transporter ATP-binding protein UgpC [Rhodothermales bacterium]
MATVKLEQVRKVYENGVVAVHGADFEVRDGEFVVLVGPSGCGKSTTLRMIAGLESITSGTLWIGDRVVNDVLPKDRDIAMVFQNYALYPHMSVYENMAFGLKLRKYSKAEIEKRVHQAADILGIRSILDRKPKQLSGGQRQRVAVGRAIVRKPQVFLFDEPLSNLDAKLRVQTRTEISKLHRQLGATMIYVTHDQVEAMTMGDRIVVLKDGYIQQIDTPLNLYNHPENRFVAGFIGSPAMNFLQGKILQDDGLYFRAFGNAFTIPVGGRHEQALEVYVGREVVLGIRPEDIYVAGSPYITNSVADASMLLDVLEPMGNEIFVYARSLEQTLVARVAPQPLPSPGQSIQLAFDLTKLHFFDADTDEVIRSYTTTLAA